MPDIFDASQEREKKTAAAESAKTESHAEVNSGTTDSSLDEPVHKITRDVNEYSMVMREEQPTNNPFKAYVAKPDRIFFDSQHAEERVLLLLRRHPVTQMGWILTAILLAIAPILFNAIGLLEFLPSRFQFAATLGWYLIVIGFALESFLSWFYNVYIITDERIIDVDFYNLLYKNISAAKIDNIEDITTRAGGVTASIFNYGTVLIQTAGSVTEFDFEDVPQPAKVTAFLNELLLEEEREQLENRAN